jgi:hypothetical protein
LNGWEYPLSDLKLYLLKPFTLKQNRKTGSQKIQTTLERRKSETKGGKGKRNTEVREGRRMVGGEREREKKEGKKEGGKEESGEEEKKEGRKEKKRKEISLIMQLLSSEFLCEWHKKLLL